MTAGTLGGDRIIARGVGRGLRFNAEGGIAGYTVGITEIEVQRELERILGPGDVAYDVGASIGFLTVICARLVGPGGSVVAFEPSPRAAARLRHNVALNGFEHVSVAERAVGEAAGVAHMHDAEGLVWGSLVADGTLVVPVTTLDDEVSAGCPPPRLVKMDIEGFEVQALRGMRRTLREHRPVVLCEIHDTFVAVEAALAEARYSVRRLEGDVASDPRYGYVVAMPEAT